MEERVWGKRFRTRPTLFVFKKPVRCTRSDERSPRENRSFLVFTDQAWLGLEFVYNTVKWFYAPLAERLVYDCRLKSQERGYKGNWEQFAEPGCKGRVDG